MTSLPHTRSRPAHWAAIAVALAAVLGAATLVQPSGATAKATQASSAPDPEAARYPLNCGPGQGDSANGSGADGESTANADVLADGSADFDGDGRAESVAVVRCHSAGGTPPSAVFVLGAAEQGERPTVAATLVPAREQMTVQGLKVTPDAISATLLGYSSPDVPRCCPDKQRKVRWEWRDGRFVLVPGAIAGSV